MNTITLFFSLFLDIKNAAIGLLNDQQKSWINGAVAEAERKTVCEIKPLLQNHCAYYVWAQVLGALIATCAILCITLIPLYGHFGGSLYVDHLGTSIVGTVVVFFTALYFMGHWKWYLHACVKQDVLSGNAIAKIDEVIAEKKLDRTKARNCVVVAGFLTEGYCAVKADEGISGTITDNDLRKPYEILAPGLKTWDAEKITQAFVDAVNAIGDMLAEKYPIQPDDENEVPDTIIIR